MAYLLNQRYRSESTRLYNSVGKRYPFGLNSEGGCCTGGSAEFSGSGNGRRFFRQLPCGFVSDNSGPTNGVLWPQLANVTWFLHQMATLCRLSAQASLPKSNEPQILFSWEAPLSGFQAWAVQNFGWQSETWSTARTISADASAAR